MFAKQLLPARNAAVVSKRASLRVRCEATATPSAGRKASPLEKGGTLSGDQALGKDAAAATKKAAAGIKEGGTYMQITEDGYFRDDRWVDGCWDFQQFKHPETGETNWDAVVDAEASRRRLLEESPIPSRNDDPVRFDTSMVPWWVWVRRYHLPVAEKVNGRAAMIGYMMALWVDQFSGAGIAEQQDSFFGKILLFAVVFGCLFIRETKDFHDLKNLVDEANFYDKQWNATWEGVERPSETEN